MTFKIAGFALYRSLPSIQFTLVYACQKNEKISEKGNEQTKVEYEN